jgi:membrane protease YdiL (CAAX protease family)
MDAALWLVPLFAVFILQGSTEELVMRGYMLQAAGQQIPGPAAIAGTSLLFSAAHLDFEPIPFLNIVLYAVFACVIALADGSLSPAARPRSRRCRSCASSSSPRTRAWRRPDRDRRSPRSARAG